MGKDVEKVVARITERMNDRLNTCERELKNMPPESVGESSHLSIRRMGLQYERWGWSAAMAVVSHVYTKMILDGELTDG